MKRMNRAGFTLVELLLAMTLFSAVMIVATVGFIGMNRTFTRSLIRKELSETAQAVTQDVTRGLRAEGINAEVRLCSETVSNPANCYIRWSAVCVGGTRYIWRVGTTGIPTTDPPLGLYRDAGPCTAPINSTKTLLLSDKYRVRHLRVTALNSSNADGLFRVEGVFTTADQSALSTPAGGDPFTITCLGSSQAAGAQSCAVEKFNFVVSARNRE